MSKQRENNVPPPAVVTEIESAIRQATSELTSMLDSARQRRDVLRVDDGELGWPGYVPRNGRLAKILAAIRDASIADAERDRLYTLARSMRENLWDACVKKIEGFRPIVVGSRVHDVQDGRNSRRRRQGRRRVRQRQQRERNGVA